MRICIMLMQYTYNVLDLIKFMYPIHSLRGADDFSLTFRTDNPWAPARVCMCYFRIPHGVTTTLLPSHHNNELTIAYFLLNSITEKWLLPLRNWRLKFRHPFTIRVAKLPSLVSAKSAWPVSKQFCFTYGINFLIFSLYHQVLSPSWHRWDEKYIHIFKIK